VYPRSLVLIFGIQALDHASHGCCCSISSSHSRYSCYSSQAVLCKHSPRTTAVLRTFAVSFTVIAIALRAISSPCHYRYPPRSTEPIPIPLVLHHVVLQISPLHHCHFSLSSYPLAHPVAIHLRRTLPPRHELQHPSLTGVRPLERVYCHECVRACCPSNVAACPP
jgi:hypothetical protein